jgi:hypothetical protein
MENQELSLKCSCGGTVTVKVAPGQKSAAAECACSRIVLWSGEVVAAPPALGICVSDSVKPLDKFGG